MGGSPRPPSCIWAVHAGIIFRFFYDVRDLPSVHAVTSRTLYIHIPVTMAPSARSKSRAHLSFFAILVLGLSHNFGLIFPSSTNQKDIKRSMIVDTDTLPPCVPLDISLTKNSIYCLQKCKPDANQTVDGRGLDMNEKMKMTSWWWW